MRPISEKLLVWREHLWYCTGILIALNSENLWPWLNATTERRRWHYFKLIHERSFEMLQRLCEEVGEPSEELLIQIDRNCQEIFAFIDIIDLTKVFFPEYQSLHNECMTLLERFRKGIDFVRWEARQMLVVQPS